MDEIFVLMNKIIVDLQGFNDSHFRIFPESEYDELVRLWNTDAKRNPNKFISFLSPSQKDIVTEWAIERTPYLTVDLIIALENFTKYLKTLDSVNYPTTKRVSQSAPRAPRSSTTPCSESKKHAKRKLKGWKRMVFTVS